MFSLTEVKSSQPFLELFSALYLPAVVVRTSVVFLSPMKSNW